MFLSPVDHPDKLETLAAKIERNGGNRHTRGL